MSRPTRDTSTASYREERGAGRLAASTLECVQWLRELGSPATGSMADREQQRRHGGAGNWHRRLLDAVRRGLVVEQGTMRDPVSGKTCIAYAVAGGPGLASTRPEQPSMDVDERDDEMAAQYIVSQSTEEDEEAGRLLLEAMS